MNVVMFLLIHLTLQPHLAVCCHFVFCSDLLILGEFLNSSSACVLARIKHSDLNKIPWIHAEEQSYHPIVCLHVWSRWLQADLGVIYRIPSWQNIRFW